MDNKNFNIEENEAKNIYQYDDYSNLSNSTQMYLREISKYPRLNYDETINLINRMNNGDESAKVMLVNCNLKLVISVAKKYSLASGMNLLDLIQEGNMGLMRAIEYFDVTKGCELSTYATWWIRQKIERAVENKSRVIRIPSYLHLKILEYKRTYEKLKLTIGHDPNLEELEAELKWNKDDIIIVQQQLNETISLNQLIGDEEDSELEIFVSSNDNSVESISIDRQLKRDIIKLLKQCNLKNREIEIIIYYYGLFGNRLSLEQIGQIYNISRERVRHIREAALIKIRKNKHVKELAIYTNDVNESIRKIDEYRNEYNKKRKKKIIYND